MLDGYFWQRIINWIKNCSELIILNVGSVSGPVKLNKNREVGEPQVTKLRKLWKPKSAEMCCWSIQEFFSRAIFVNNSYTYHRAHTTVNSTQLTIERRPNQKNFFNKIMLLENPIELFVSTLGSTCLRYKEGLKNNGNRKCLWTLFS